MSVYIGLCNYGTDETEIGEPSQGNPSEIHSDLDMKNYGIIYLRQSEENGSDAATVGYISDWIVKINRVKVDWNGGTMDGDLNMGQFKLKQPGDPKDDEDVIKKIF